MFQQGFAELRAALGAEIVGDCIENEWHDGTTGDGFQSASRGQLTWRKRDGATVFTDAAGSWLATPAGPQWLSSADALAWVATPTAPLTPPTTSMPASAPTQLSQPTPFAAGAAQPPIAAPSIVSGLSAQSGVPVSTPRPALPTQTPTPTIATRTATPSRTPIQPPRVQPTRSVPRGQFTPRPGASIRQLQAGASFANSGAIAVNVTTNRLYITATNGPSASGVLEVLDGATNQIIDQVTVPSSPIKVAVDSQRNRVYVLGVNSSSGGNAYSVYVLDGGTNTFTRTVPLSGGVNNRPALVTDEGDNLVFLLTQTGIDMLDGNSFVVQTVMNTITASSILPTNLAIDPYQRLLAVAGVDTSENKLALATYSLPNAGQPQPLVPLKRVNLYATTAQDIGPLMVDTDDQRLVVGYATPCDRISCYRVHAIRESLDTGGYGSLNVSAPDQAALMPAYDRTLDHVYLRLNDTVLKVIDLTALIRGNFNAWFVATAPFTQDAISDMQANPITNIVYATDAVTQEIITYQDSGPACWPGPPVTISPTADHQGGLSVVVASVGSANFLQNIQFGVASNGLLDGLGLSGSTGNTRVTFQPGTTQVQFTVRRAAAGMWTTVPFTVGYTCGTWPTFVGGGPDAF